MLGASNSGPNFGRSLHEYMTALWLVQTGYFIEGKRFDTTDGDRVTFLYFSDRPFIVVCQSDQHKTRLDVSVFDVVPTRDTRGAGK